MKQHAGSRIVLLLLVVLTLPAPRLVRAADTGSNNQTPATPTTDTGAPAPTAAPAAAAIDLNAMVDVYSGYNFNGTSSGTNQIRAFDVQDGGVALNFAKLTLAAKAARAGVRIDAGFGNATDALYAADPSSKTDPQNARWLSHIEQAYGSVAIPVGRGLTLDGGKFVTQHGFEVIETRDNWNYSRSLLFTWAIPFFHTGLRLSYAASDKLGLMMCWVNGWNTVIEEGSSMRDAGLQVSYRPRPNLTLVWNDMLGLEKAPTAMAGAPPNVRNLLDASITWTATEKLSLALNFDWGTDSVDGQGVSWSGLAGYARYQARAFLAAAARVEYFADSDGFMTGTKQHLFEATATGELSGTVARTSVLLRLEYRHDHSDAMVFDASMPTSQRDQDTALVGAVAFF